MKFFLHAITLMLVISSSVFAQRKATGNISDTGGNPIEGVTVTLKDSNLSAVSDATGRYLLELPEGENTLVFEKDGFELTEVRSDKAITNIVMETLNLDLFNMSLEELLNTTIESAGKTKQVVSEIPASIVVLTRESIEKQGYQTLEEIISNIPGLYSLGNAYWEGATNFGVRGFASPGANTNMMILVNGVNQMNDFSNSFSTDRIIVPVEAIDRIEVVRGPNSVVYGSSAFMCLINIITNAEKDNNRISAIGGSNNTYGTFLRVASQSVVFNAGISNSDGINVPYSELQSNPTVIEGWGLNKNATTENQFWKQKKYFDLSVNSGDFKINLNYVNHHLGVPGTRPSANTDRGYKMTINEIKAQAEYRKQIGKGLTLVGKGLLTSYNMDGDARFFNANSYSSTHVGSRAFELEANLLYTSENNKLSGIVGINNRTALDAGMLVNYPIFDRKWNLNSWSNLDYHIDDNSSMSLNSAFIQGNYKITEQFSVTAGVRLEQLNEYNITGRHGAAISEFTGKDTTLVLNYGTIPTSDVQIVPRAALIYKLNDQNIIKLMYGMANKRASILENVNLGGTGLYNLDFAQMQTLEANYTTIIEDMINLNVSLFKNDLNNLIMRTPESVSATNAGQMQTLGAEVTATIKPSDDILVEASVTYQTTENKTSGYEGVAQAYSPNLLAYLKASYQIQDGLSVALNGRFISSMESEWELAKKDAEGLITQEASRYGDTSPSYMVFDANVRWNNIYKGLFINAKVSNILDQEVRYPTGAASPWSDKGMLDFGRQFFVTAGYNF